MVFQIIWQERAKTTLRSISNYLSAQDQSVANRIVNAIVEATEVLQTFPYIGAIHQRGATVEIREILQGNYRIFYQVLDEKQTVEILAVWHASRRDPKF